MHFFNRKIFWSRRLLWKKSWPLFSLTLFGPDGLRAPPEVAFAMRSWPFLLPIFALSIFPLSFFLLRLLLLTHFRETTKAEILFPSYLEITWRKNYNFFLNKNKRFLGVFSTFYGQHSVTAAWANPIPWNSFSLYIYCFSHTSGDTQEAEIFFALIFWHKKKKYQIKIYQLFYSFIFYEKNDFGRRSLDQP